MSQAHAGAHAAPRTPEDQARLDAALTEIFETGIVFNQTLGLRVRGLRGPDAGLRFDMRQELVGHPAYGRLHGGVISACLDAMGGFALMVAIADRHPADSPEQVLQRFLRMGTIDLRVDYLRQGMGRHFDAMAEVTRLGGRVGSVQMRLVNDEGLLIATGAAAYMVS